MTNGCNKNWKHNVNAWWWSSGVKDEIQKKKEAFKEMTNTPTEETKNDDARLKKLPRMQLLEV